MTFYQNKKNHIYTFGRTSMRFFLIISFSICTPFTTEAQIYIPPEQESEIVLPPNEYASRYKEAPRKPATSVTWYAYPQKIASRIPLGEINVHVRRLKDDTPYLEKTVDGIKGRIFLKETRGMLYRIYDIMFIPYILLRGDDSEKQIQKQTDATDEAKFTNSNKSKKQEIDAEMQKKETRVPTYAERNTGKSLFVEIHIFRTNGALDSLIRYADEDILFSESYQYTSKGALRTLTRKYSDDSLFRFVYYFSDGGLEEEFHQNADKSISYKKYTRTGQLKESAQYNSDGLLKYKITYSFDKNGNIKSKEETTLESRSFSIYKNNKKYETLRYEKVQKKEDKEAELLVSTVRYNYKTGTETEQDAKFVHERNSESFFDKKGRLVKKREYVDFVLTKEIEYVEKGIRIETQFFKGKPVLRIRYVGSHKEREEILK